MGGKACVLAVVGIMLSASFVGVALYVLITAEAQSYPDPHLDPDLGDGVKCNGFRCDSYQHELGDLLVVEVKAVNDGGGGEGWISVSLTGNPSNVEYAESSLDGGVLSEGDGIYLPGHTLTGCYQKCEVIATYPLVEGHGNWDSGTHHNLKFEVFPEHTGLFTFLVRVLIKKDGNYYHDPLIGIQGQQNEYEYFVALEVRKTQSVPFVIPTAGANLPKPFIEVPFLPKSNLDPPPEGIILEKSGSYGFGFDVVNPDPANSRTVQIKVHEESEGQIIGPSSDQSSEKVIGPLANEQFTFVFNENLENSWPWGQSASVIEWLGLGNLVGGTTTDALAKASRQASKNPISTKTVAASVDKQFPQLTKNLEGMGGFTKVLDLAFGLIELASLDYDKYFIYNFEDTVDSSVENSIDGIPGAVIIHLIAPVRFLVTLGRLVLEYLISTYLTVIAIKLALGLAASIIGAIVAAIAIALALAAEAWLFSEIDQTLRSFFEDPHRTDYDQVADPEDFLCGDPTLPDPVDPMTGSLHNVATLSRELRGYAGALSLTYERYLGAVDDGSVDGMSKQIQRLNELSTEADEIIYEMDSNFEVFSDELDSLGFSVTPEDMVLVKEYVRDYGLHGEETLLEACDANSAIVRYNIANMNEEWVLDNHIVDNFDLLAGFRYLDFSDSPVGPPFDDDQYAPIADACGPYYGEEGSPVSFSAACSDVGNGTIIGYEWDFDGDGSADSFEASPTYTWYDNVQQTVMLRITVLYYVEISVGYGKTKMVPIIRTAQTTFTAIIMNLDPTIEDVNDDSPSRIAGHLFMDLTLRVAGEKWHDVDLVLRNVTDNKDIASLRVYRTPGSPDAQSQTETGILIDIEKMYIIEATYNPHDDPINGQIQGSSPLWVFFTFKDGVEMLHHNFNVEQSTFRDSDRWIHVEPWVVDISPIFIGHEWTFLQKTTDPGTDDLCLRWDWGDGMGTTRVYNWPSGGVTCGDDGGSTPYDLDQNTYPPTTEEKFYHTYTFEGNFVVTLRVRDDEDGPPPDWEAIGTDSDSLVVRAIHLPHIAPIR